MTGIAAAAALGFREGLLALVKQALPGRAIETAEDAAAAVAGIFQPASTGLAAALLQLGEAAAIRAVVVEAPAVTIHDHRPKEG